MSAMAMTPDIWIEAAENAPCVHEHLAIPDPRRFNPLTEAWWSLSMAVAWTTWRSLDMVCEHWDAGVIRLV